MPAEGGLNEGLLEDLYERYRDDPSSVPEGWRRYFESAATTPPPAPAPAPSTPAPPAPTTPPSASPAPSTLPSPAPPAEPAPATPATPAAPAAEPTAKTPPSGESGERLRGAAARTVANMEASLRVPTATSVRAVPAKLLEVNRQILNNQLGRVGHDKVSFTHVIAYAVVRALDDFPGLRCTYEAHDGQPTLIRHEHVNLGLAVDVTRPDGYRTLLVPVIRTADELDFVGFWAAYEALIRKVRANQLSPDDLAGATGSITNPGMIGTVHSVPRLMPGQAFIVGVGTIGFPAEFAGADPHTIAELGVSPITTLTNTYDHRVIGGAESGEFLRRIHGLLLGEDGFYDQVFRSAGVPYEPARWLVDRNPLTDAGVNEKVVNVHALINMYRVRGHLIANLDPLGRREPHTHPELDIAHYGLSIWDLDREFPIGSLGAGMLPETRMPLRDILGVLRDAYARTVGVEYMHIQEPAQKEWIQQRVETPPVAFDAALKRHVLGLLNAAEAFERFLGTKYLGQKRFSLEGAETLIPMLDAVCSAAADTGMTEVVMGMAHRGRLNVLTNVLGKSYAQVFREFEGELDPSSTHGSGDVKYHLGQHATHQSPAGHVVSLRLAANPSHLEAVDPVVEGMARAVADRVGDPVDAALPLLVHGDAAFAGQGVVAETLNLSEVEGYDVGGTVHVVVNNQLGFTTAPESGRSGVYATDVAKMVQAPIFHVNGDDPEACVRVMDMAFAFREAFHKDVVVDLVCYRRYGHNEADEPAFTQPRMYALIESHPSVRELYTEQLVQRGDLTAEETDAAVADFRTRLDRAFEETHENHDEVPEPVPSSVELADAEPVPTAVDRSVLERVVSALTTWPDTFHVNPKLARLLRAHRSTFDDGTIDWSLAEAAAFGSLLLEGTPVRVAGQDTRRGTFSQRHGVLVDADDEAEYVPLNHLDADQAPFRLYDSVLSEFAALGFEYGYSVAAPESLTAWEAQFGDFADGAQVTIDEFVVAAEDKWGQTSGLTMLLPHGYEGQGADHSSARLERFLTLSADDNLRVVYPSTAAQYFHVLRRQARTPRRVPLVCLTPKRYLRLAHTRSPVEAFTHDRFHPVLGDRSPALDADVVKRVLVCSGKVGHELMDARDRADVPLAVVRVEELAPFPEDELQAALDHYPHASQVWWVQEEPLNMGAWHYIDEPLHRVVGMEATIDYVARKPSPSPATGSAKIHEFEQQALLEAALTGL